MIVEDGPLEPEREGRDVAAKWIWKRLVERRRV